MKPEQNVEKLPKGEILKSSLILIELVFLKVGGFRLVRSIGTKATENNKLWQFYGMFNWIKLNTVNDIDGVPRILEPVSYYHTQNQLSTEADMKISIVRVPAAFGDIVAEWKAFFKFGDGIPLENETTIKLEFTMKKIFDV